MSCALKVCAFLSLTVLCLNQKDLNLQTMSCAFYKWPSMGTPVVPLAGGRAETGTQERTKSGDSSGHPFGGFQLSSPSPSDLQGGAESGGHAKGTRRGHCCLRPRALGGCPG